MELVLRKVIESALADEGRIVLEGEPHERLDNGDVFVSPSTRQSYDGSKGDKLGDLPADAIRLEKSTWGFRAPWNKRKGAQPSPNFSGKWYDHPDWRNVLRQDTIQIIERYPDVALYLDENEELLWKGVVGSIGDLELRYVPTRPVGSVRVLLLSQPESVTEKVDESARKNRLTAVQSIDLAVDIVTNSR